MKNILLFVVLILCIQRDQNKFNRAGLSEEETFKIKRELKL
jgi:hypothetical protein